MKLSEDVEVVEVWSNTVFFNGPGFGGSVNIRRPHCPHYSRKYDALFAVLDPVLALMIHPNEREDGGRSLATFTREEFETITEGVDCEMPEWDG